MKFDSTITFSIILAIIAVVSPMITASMNNAHNLKIKKLEMYELAKRKSLENFINAVSSVITIPCMENLKLYYSALNNLYIYFSIKNAEDIKKLNNQIDQFNDGDDSMSIQKNLNNITVVLSKQIKKK